MAQVQFFSLYIVNYIHIHMKRREEMSHTKFYQNHQNLKFLSAT